MSEIRESRIASEKELQQEEKRANSEAKAIQKHAYAEIRKVEKLIYPNALSQCRETRKALDTVPKQAFFFRANAVEFVPLSADEWQTPLGSAACEKLAIAFEQLFRELVYAMWGGYAHEHAGTGIGKYAASCRSRPNAVKRRREAYRKYAPAGE